MFLSWPVLLYARYYLPAMRIRLDKRGHAEDAENLSVEVWLKEVEVSSMINFRGVIPLYHKHWSHAPTQKEPQSLPAPYK